jgi:hypothetical protein
MNVCDALLPVDCWCGVSGDDGGREWNLEPIESRERPQMDDLPVDENAASAKHPSSRSSKDMPRSGPPTHDDQAAVLASR